VVYGDFHVPIAWAATKDKDCETRIIGCSLVPDVVPPSQWDDSKTWVALHEYVIEDTELRRTENGVTFS
jgi:hypothetical protein